MMMLVSGLRSVEVAVVAKTDVRLRLPRTPLFTTSEIIQRSHS